MIETLEGAWHQRFDEAGISASDTFNGRLLRWLNTTLGRTYTNLPEAQQAYATARGAHNWASLLHAQAGPAVPVVTPANYVNVFSLRFNDPGQPLSSLLRTCGPSMGGYTDGIGLLGTGIYSTYDARLQAGPSNDAYLNPDYAWPGGWKPAAISSNKLVLSAGAASLVTGLAAVMPYRANSTAYANFGVGLTTLDAYRFKGDFVAECRCVLPNIVGCWPAVWFWTVGRTIIASDAPQAEIDFIEYAPGDAAGRRTAHMNLHGHKALPDTTYYDTFGEADLGVNLDTTEHRWTITRFGDVVTWYLDGVQKGQLTFPSNYVAKDDFFQVIFNIGVGDASFSSFPGTYSSASGLANLEIRSFDMWKAASSIATEVWSDRGQVTGLGPDRVVGLPNTAGVEPGFWGDNGSTHANGTAKGGITPVVVASAGADWHRRYYGGKAGTARPFNEAGAAIAANGGFVSGVTYRLKYTFDYGTSAKGYFQVETSGGSATSGWFAGDAITMFSGSVSSAVFGTDSSGRRTLTFNWTATATGDSVIGFGPFSNNSGETVILYDLEVRPYL